MSWEVTKRKADILVVIRRKNDLDRRGNRCHPDMAKHHTLGRARRPAL